MIDRVCCLALALGTCAVAVLPVSIAGLGTRDAAALFFFAQVGATAEMVVAWSLLAVALQAVLIALIGFLSWAFYYGGYGLFRLAPGPDPPPEAQDA